jgi:hypothetical protein
LSAPTTTRSSSSDGSEMTCAFASSSATTSGVLMRWSHRRSQIAGPPWRSIMVPLPPKVYLSGESAESTAHYLIRAYAAASGVPAGWERLAGDLLSQKVSLRSFLRSNADYKSRLSGRGRGGDATRVLRLSRLPHWVWVVEAHDRDERAAGRPSVMAEFVFDSTSSDRSPRVDAVSMPGFTTTFPPDGGSREAVPGPAEHWRSHLLPQ